MTKKSKKQEVKKPDFRIEINRLGVEAVVSRTEDNVELKINGLDKIKTIDDLNMFTTLVVELAEKTQDNYDTDEDCCGNDCCVGPCGCN